MNYTIYDDKIKLGVYSLLCLIITFILMVVAAYFFATNLFIISFFAITGIWFSVKYMCKYGLRLIKNTPLVEFKKNEVTLYALDKELTMEYSDITKVNILKDFKSVKLFFSGKGVNHPSGYQYIGVVYYSKIKELKEIESNIIVCLSKNNVSFNIVDQK